MRQQNQPLARHHQPQRLLLDHPADRLQIPLVRHFIPQPRIPPDPRQPQPIGLSTQPDHAAGDVHLIERGASQRAIVIAAHNPQRNLPPQHPRPHRLQALGGVLAIDQIAGVQSGEDARLIHCGRRVSVAVGAAGEADHGGYFAPGAYAVERNGVRAVSLADRYTFLMVSQRSSIQITLFA
jgi:hypothetical protein